MNLQELIKSLEENIKFKFKKLENLHSERCITNNKHLNDRLNPHIKPDERNSILNQALSDAILNSLASLIDYYCIYCMLKLGATEDKIRKIQYRPLTNSFLIEKSVLLKHKKSTATINTLESEFKAKISSIINIETVNINDYWTAFLGDAISYTLKEYGILENNKFELKIDEATGQLAFDPRVEKYLYYMQPLFCNAFSASGVKYCIYIDINNFLKHNAVPYLSSQIESFGAEQRIFSYFEIRATQSVFLKDGILKDLVTSSFFEMKSELEKKSKEDKHHLCQLEENWGLGAILEIDRTNGFISSNKELLHFYIDGILFAKSENTVLIEADSCLRDVISRLHHELLSKLEYNLE